jgi:hypothetical protein
MADNPRHDWTKFGVTSIITVCALVFGLLQFGQTYAQSVRQPFLQSQMNQCIAASENAARLASTLNFDTWKKAREEFWMLYLGPLAIVENVDPTGKNLVAATMVAFGDELRKIDAAAPKLPLSHLENRALDVAHACRDLMVARWRVGFLRWLSAD